MINKSETEVNILVKDIYIKHIEKAVQKYVSNEIKFISVIRKDVSDADEKYILEDAKYINSNVEDLIIEYDKNDVISAFFDDAWDNLKIVEKVASCIWYDEYVSYEMGKGNLNYVFNVDQKEAVKYVYEEEIDDYLLSINPYVLSKSNGYEVMYDLIQICLEDDLVLDAKNIERYNEIDDDTMLLLANALKKTDKPKEYEDFINGKELSEEALKRVAFFANQPIEIEKRIAYDFVDEKIEEIQNYLGYEDIKWAKNKPSYANNNKKLDDLFIKMFPNEKKEIFYKTRYRAQIKFLQDKYENGLKNKIYVDIEKEENEEYEREKLLGSETLQVA